LVDEFELYLDAILGNPTGSQALAANRNRRLAGRRRLLSGKLHIISQSALFSAHCRRYFVIFTTIYRTVGVRCNRVARLARYARAMADRKRYGDRLELRTYHEVDVLDGENPPFE
jgi:hypothetical protein